MIIVYGNQMCKDCRNLKLNLDKFNIDYTYIDIFESLANLKMFLAYRDKYETLFKDIKALGGVGIPLIIDHDKPILDWEKYLKDLNHQDLEYETIGQACSLDGKGC